ncbi:MAG: hypothetical protein AAFN94_09330 [Pseudomonadota bacterium]
MRRLVFITGHFPQQKRRTSMLWVTDHLQDDGWHVTYATVGYSWMSRIMRDRRLRALGHAPRTGATRISPTLTGLFGYSPYHPVNTRLGEPHVLNLLFAAYWRPRLGEPLSQADLVIIESGPPVALAPLVADLAPQATRIYRVSDDIRLLNAPLSLLSAEAQHQHFHRISTGSPLIAQRFSDHLNVTIDPMGVPHAQISQCRANPYRRTGRPIAVCAGSTLLDMDQVAQIARGAPRWDIHVIGRLKSAAPTVPNVTWHGEKPFSETLAFVRHADIGLAPFADRPGVEYQITNSNRILLYRHTGLPILVPDRLATPDIPCLISHSAPDWRTRCETYGRRPEAIPDWSALARSLVQNGDTVPPDVTSTLPDTMLNARVRTSPPLASTA